MTRGSRLLTGVVLALLCGTGGCGLTRGAELGDLKLVSVSAVDPGRSNASDVPWHDRPMFVVNFSVGRDLRAYAAQHEYHVGNDASLCRDGEIDPARPLQNDPYVFDDGGRTLDQDAGDAARPATYHIYIATKPSALAGKTVFDYDLRREAQDVCIKLRGGNMSGGTFASKTLVIPKSSVASALSGARP